MSNNELVYAIVQVADGVRSVELAQNPRIRLLSNGFSPERPNKVDTMIGRHGDYKNVTGDLRFNVNGDGDMNAALQLITDLSTLLDNADAWGNRNGETPVTYRVLLQGSTLTSPLEAVIVGPDGRRPMLQLPANFIQDLGTGGEVGPIVLRFERRGQLLGKADVAGGGSSMELLNTITTRMSEILDIVSPTKITINLQKNDTSPTGLSHSDGYIVVTDSFLPNTQPATDDDDDNSMIYIQGATRIGDSANNAYSNDVARFDANSLKTSAIDGVLRSHPIPTTTTFETVVPLLAVRNNTSSVDWMVRAVSRLSTDTTEVGIPTPWKLVARTNNNVQVLNLGPISRASGKHPYLFIEVRALNDPGTAGHTLDVNNLMPVPMTENAKILKINAQTHTGRAVKEIVLDHRVLNDRSPRIYSVDDSGGEALMSWGGYPFISTSGENIEIFLSLPSGTKWVADHPQEGGELYHTVTVTRHKAYLIPV